MRNTFPPPVVIPLIVKGALDVWKDKVFESSSVAPEKVVSLAEEFIELYDLLQKYRDTKQSKADLVILFDSILSEKDLTPLKTVDTELQKSGVSLINVALKAECTPIAARFFTVGFKALPFPHTQAEVKQLIDIFLTQYTHTPYLLLLLKLFGMNEIEAANPRILSEIAMKKPEFVVESAPVLLAYGYDMQLPSGIGVYNTALTCALGGGCSDINNLDKTRIANAENLILRGAKFDWSIAGIDGDVKATILMPFTRNQNRTSVMKFLFPFICVKYAAKTGCLSADDAHLTQHRIIMKALEHGFVPAPSELHMVANDIICSMTTKAFLPNSLANTYLSFALHHPQYFTSPKIIEIDDLRECIWGFFQENRQLSLVCVNLTSRLLGDGGADAWTKILDQLTGLTSSCRALLEPIPKNAKISLDDKKLFKEEVLYQSVKTLFENTAQIKR